MKTNQSTMIIRPYLIGGPDVKRELCTFLYDFENAQITFSTQSEGITDTEIKFLIAAFRDAADGLESEFAKRLN